MVDNMNKRKQKQCRDFFFYIIYNRVLWILFLVHFILFDQDLSHLILILILTNLVTRSESGICSSSKIYVIKWQYFENEKETILSISTDLDLEIKSVNQKNTSKNNF